MTVYASRIKRNLRETTEQRDAMLERIGLLREVMDTYAERDPQSAKLIVEILDYVESGQMPDEFAGGMH